MSYWDNIGNDALPYLLKGEDEPEEVLAKRYPGMVDIWIGLDINERVYLGPNMDLDDAREISEEESAMRVYGGKLAKRTIFSEELLG